MLKLRADGFDWDEGNREKYEKHGVSLAEVEGIFRNTPLLAPDPEHSAEEDRLLAVGRTNTGRPVFVAFTLRMQQGRQLIHPISARYMHKKEIVAYEKESAETENR